ncbi:hypothetical protein OG311_14305 [Streptomyces sp. NBC_01343]|uniref:hypothetical protein n=1 Tax=Streptomyces sp. NBC_01343 TaxID=2903832 RepID=UPI002E13C6E4|nr:hypothetical protein OG311_14305 [Streptomyces sp. NBC_01343]
MARQTIRDRLPDALAFFTGQHTVRCPHPGCIVRIRYRGVTRAEAKRLTAQATDHTHH